MKKVFSIIAVVALFSQLANAQTVKLTPASQIIAINGSTGSTVGISVELLVPLAPGSEFNLNTSSFNVNPSPTTSADNGATVTVTNSATIAENVDVFIPAGTPAGTVITVTVSVNYTGTSGAPVGPYIGTATITITARLAAELMSINAKAAQGKNALSWATASEKDNNKFVVERSVNGVDFTQVGEVKAAGTSQTANNYSFLDENVTGSVNYYRIQSVDMTGKMNASKVVAVASKGTLAAKAVGSQLNIVSDVDGQATVNVFNLSGQVVATQVVNLTSGASQHALNFDQTGLFIVNVTNGKSTVSTKMFR